jgi:hypothetical protein
LRVSEIHDPQDFWGVEQPQNSKHYFFDITVYVIDTREGFSNLNYYIGEIMNVFRK